jgi:hypothetical protein
LRRILVLVRPSRYRTASAEPLQDPDYFAQVRVDPELGTVVWPNGYDLDPDVLHGDFEAVQPQAAHASHPA